MTQKCSYCHHPNRDNAQFCAGCGNPLNVNQTKSYFALQSGQVIRSYRVLNPLGKGGMGAIYLVEDLEAFGRQRVIKEMLQYFDTTDPQEVQKAQKRFKAEGRTLASLHHHGIPDITAYFSEGGRNYIVMEYAEGDDLLQGLSHENAQGNWIKGKPYPVEDVLRWGRQLCSVLAYLARQNPPVVHHDVKPANIIIDKNTNEARLVDFGTAKARLVIQPGGNVGMRKSSIYGTAGYAAPEMYPPHNSSSPRSDVYSLAVTLYHLLTDDDPRDHPFDFPRMDKLDSGLRMVLQGALHDDSQQRPDALSFRHALQGIEATLSGEVKAPFVFPNGQQARTPREVARLCDRQWNAAKKLLFDGDFEHWLRQSLFRSDLANQAAKIMQAGGDQDEGLETFLHAVDPSLPYPKLQLKPQRLHLGRLAPDEETEHTLRVRNRSGRGILEGAIKVDPTAPWLTVPGHFKNSGDVKVTIDAKSLQEGTQLKTNLKFKTPYEEQVVRVKGRVAFPLLRALMRIGLALFIGVLVGGGLAFLGMNTPGESLTYAGIGVGSLAFVFWRVRRKKKSWKKKAFRLLLYGLPLSGILILVNQLCYNSWSLLRRTDTLSGWVLPMASGAIAGLTIGLVRVLSRPGHRLVPWLSVTIILLGSLGYIGQVFHRVGSEILLKPTATTEYPTKTITARTTTPTHRLPTNTPQPGEIHPGIQVVVVTDGRRLNVRNTPGTDASITTRVEPGTRLEVLDGPRTASGYTWWRVKLPDGSMGWAAENWLKPVE